MEKKNVPDTLEFLGIDDARFKELADKTYQVLVLTKPDTTPSETVQAIMNDVPDITIKEALWFGLKLGRVINNNDRRYEATIAIAEAYIRNPAILEMVEEGRKLTGESANEFLAKMSIETADALISRMEEDEPEEYKMRKPTAEA